MDFPFTGANLSVALRSREIRSIRQVFEVVIRPRIVLCVPITARGKLVLIQEHRVSVDTVVTEFPAGRLDINEEAETAIRREVLEEAGFRPTTVQKIGTLLTAPHFSDEIMDVFIARGKIFSAPTPTPREDLRATVQLWASEVDTLIRDGGMTDAKSIAALALARLLDPSIGVGE